MPCLRGELDFLVAGPFPFAHRGDDLERRSERLKGDVEADLIVALAGAAVGDGLGSVFVGRVDHELGDERPAQGGGERILAFVEGAGHEGRPDETIDEQVAGVDGDGVHGSGFEGLLADLLDVLALAQIDREGDDVQVVLFADPGHHDRGVESAAVRQNNFVAGHVFPCADFRVMPVTSVAKTLQPQIRRKTRIMNDKCINDD